MGRRANETRDEVGGGEKAKGEGARGVRPQGSSRALLERWLKGRGTYQGAPADSATKWEESTLLYLLRVFVVCIVGPVLGRIGHLDEALSWLRRSGMAWAEAYAQRVGVGRAVRFRELGRDPTWSYKQEDASEHEQDGLTAKRAYLVRATLLQFFSAHHRQSFSAAEVGRQFKKNLPFLPLRDYEEILRLYVSKQWLVCEDGRYRFRNAFAPLNLEQKHAREARLERRLEVFAPLCQSYLEGHGYMLSIDGELPLELWYQLQKDVGEFVRQRLPMLVEQSNTDTWKDVPEFIGGAMFLLGPYPWLPPGWDEGYADAKHRHNPNGTEPTTAP